MAGVHQIEFQMPSNHVCKFLSELSSIGVHCVGAFELQDSDCVVDIISTEMEHTKFMLCFWPSVADDVHRRVDLHWHQFGVGTDKDVGLRVASGVQRLALRHGSVIIFGAVT